MNDPTPNEPAPAPLGKVKKRRTWKQRLKITLAVLIVAAVLIRIALSFLLPTVVRKVANAYDLDCTFDRMSLSLLGGNAYVWNLELRPRSGGDSIVQADYIQGSISTPNLFRGRLVVYRAEVDGVDMLIEREADGTIPLLARLLAAPEDAPISVEPEPSAEPRPVNLQPPLRIDAIRLSHVTTTFRDRSVTPVFETTVRTSLRISDVGASGAPARFELQVQADPVLDALMLSGVMRNTATTVEADLDVVLRGLHPQPAEAYLLPLGLRPLANDITVQAQMNLVAEVIADTTDVAGTLTVRDVSATVDSDEWASLKLVTLQARRINPEAVELEQLLVETGRASALRSPEGRLRVAGFELVPVAQAETAASTAPAPGVATTGPTAPLRVSLDELRLSDLQAVFEDQAVDAVGPLVARLDHFAARDIVYDTAAPSGPIALDGLVTLPGVIEAIRWSGTVTPFADEQQAAIQLRAEGIRPELLRPYLEAIGLESQLVAGRFAADIEATHTPGTDGGRISARLGNVRLTDGDAVLLDWPSAQVTGLSLRPDGAIHIQAVDITGPAFNLHRDSDGALAAMGLRTRAPVAAATTMPVVAQEEAPVQPGAVATPAAPALPRIQIDRYAWKDIQFNFEDRYDTAAPVVLAGRAGVKAAELVFDPAATEAATGHGRFHAWFELPGVVERMAVDGELRTTGQGVTIRSELNGQGITGTAIGSYLEPLGVQLTVQDGRLSGQAGATLATVDNGLRLDVDVDDMAYFDGEEELAGVGALRVSGLALQEGNLAVDRVEITRPRGRVERHEDGTLEAAGVRLVGPPPSTQPVAPQPVVTGPPPPLQLRPAPMGVTLRQFRLEDGALRVIDRAVEPALDTVVHGSVTLEEASLRSSDPAARLTLAGGIEGIVERASVAGNVKLAPDAPSAALTIEVDGIRGDALAAYMPPGVRSTLRDGRFAMALDAAMANHAAGGLDGRLIVRDLQLREKADDTTLAQVGNVTVRIARLDPAGGILAIDEISSAGVELDVKRAADGTMDALGMRLGEQAAAVDEPAVAEPADETPAAVVATTQPAADVAAMVADARRALPLLTVGKLDLKLDRLRLHGWMGPDGAPMEVARVRLHNSGPVELGGENPEQRPPLKLQVDGAVDPVVRQFAVAIEAALFESEPELTVDINTSGIAGKGLTDIAPELRNVIVGEGLTEGTFATRLTASLNYGRRGPRDLDVGRGFTATFSVKPLEFRGEPDGPVLAGFEEVRGEGITVQPRSGNVLIKSIEVVRPIGRLVHDEQGLHVLGVVIPTRQSESPDAAVVQEETPPEPAAPVAATPPERPASEIRLDRFTVTGIDVMVEDRTTTPATVVPLRTLDLEVRDVSNQMLWTGRPVRFDMLCTADKVPLPPRRGVTAQQAPSADGLELRELFSQITASGRIGMKQKPDGGAVLTGWAKTSVSGFELLGVRGLAAAQEIEIGGGVFDDSNDIRFREDGTIETRNRVVFTNLSLSEPPGGPIQRVLQLPAPIDVAIGAITDPDGSITLNLPVTIESGAVDVGKLVAPAIGAVAQVLVTAIASAPVKAVGGVGDLLGLGGRGARAPEEPVELTFLPGTATLEPAEARQLAMLAERMRRDSSLEVQLRHEMSPADVVHAQRRANPPVEDVRVMVERLRRNKPQLLAERAVLAAQARAQFAAQSEAAGESVATVRAIDRQLAQIDASLEQLGDLLRPGAAAQADRRTRAASLAVAQERFGVIEAAIAGAGVRGAAERVRKTNPQFEPIEELSHGRVIITVVSTKK